MIQRTKGKMPKYKQMISGLLSIIDGLVRLCTLGYFWSNLQYTYIVKNL